MATKFRYRIEMRSRRDMRIVEADGWHRSEEWMIFHRGPPQGGAQEYWRVKVDAIVSMETVRQ